MSQPLRVTIWNEGVHEKTHPVVQKVYPQGMGHQIKSYLDTVPGIEAIAVAQLDDPEHGLTDAVLEQTDVMTWWGHTAHDRVDDAIVEKVYQRVTQQGMGLVALHSAHYSKIFRRLMGTSCSLKWREYKGIGEKERLWLVDPAHPIADGLPEYFELERTEMYGEHFDIPQPDQQVFISWFQGGEVFRSGCCWHRGRGKVFYFRPGHETLPIYYDAHVLRVIANGIRWAAPTRIAGGIRRDNTEPLEAME
ncbi:MAG: ThuA domain-containing protein [Candidatus Hydrogenedentes bacterium]|nr:ThuA domain-containing protein [Candidatus Hydrogenedentota bacterium]